jgi:hypothetical protein
MSTPNVARSKPEGHSGWEDKVRKGGQATPHDGAVEKALAKKDPGKDWVEAQLLDASGKPVPGHRCEVHLADGSIREGVTDANGSVRFEGVAHGECRIEFPDYDPEGVARVAED